MLNIGFEKNGLLQGLLDTRDVYSVGDTTVNISKEQAVDIAMKYLPSYSYEMPDHTFVSDFNITEDKTMTELVAFPIDSLELRPYWSVKLYLNQTYPGSVDGFTLYVWANSGEVFVCSTIATGGSAYPDSSDTVASPETANLPPPIATAAVIALGLAAASVIVIKKKRK